LEAQEPIVAPRIIPIEPEPAVAASEASIWDGRLEPDGPAPDTWRELGDESPIPIDPPERWAEEPAVGEAGPAMPERGPALWRRRPARRLRFPDRLEDQRLGGRNPLDIPTFLRKQMD
jgi:hypothetical protein